MCSFSSSLKSGFLSTVTGGSLFCSLHLVCEWLYSLCTGGLSGWQVILCVLHFHHLGHRHLCVAYGVILLCSFWVTQILPPVPSLPAGQVGSMGPKSQQGDSGIYNGVLVRCRPSGFSASPCSILGICFCCISLASFSFSLWFNCSTVLQIQLTILCLTLCCGAGWWRSKVTGGVVLIHLALGRGAYLPFPPSIAPSLPSFSPPSLLLKFRDKTAQTQSYLFFKCHHGCSTQLSWDC